MKIPQKLRDLERFYHIVEAIELIEKYVADDKTIADNRTADAIFYRLQIIGEAANHLSDEYKQKFSDIPWRRIIAMRNYLVHEYFAIHNNKIMAALLDIPRIKQRIQEIIREIENA
jgi:uncharacterized protein with HEPN domain